MPDCAVFAKAPIPGYAKTRLVPIVGAEGAARLQEKLVDRALTTAVAAAIGPVTLWCAPDDENAFLCEAARRHGVGLTAQPSGDLGERMLAAFRAAPAEQGLVLIGTDCPILGPSDLRDAAALLSHADVVMAPAEDGGYGLVAARRAIPALFEGMPWGTAQVAALTRDRAQAGRLRLAELRTIWDVDTSADLRRLRETDLIDLDDVAMAGAAGHETTRASPQRMLL
jgi:rSAM/selenodomain-associated transferase 1